MTVLDWKILIVGVLFHLSHAQQFPGTSQTTYYLDQTSDCSGLARDVGRSTVSIVGKSSLPQGKPVTSCTLRLNTANEREPYRFKLQFVQIRIEDPNVQFYVYDGEFNGRLIWAFNKQNQQPGTDFDFTTGQQVTFRFTRSEEDTNYDIRVIATPVASDTARCTYEGQYGCDEYGYTNRILGTKEIVGIIGGAFGLVIIVVVIIVVCCYRKQRGISQKWKENKLGHVNTAASLHSLNGKVTNSTHNSTHTEAGSKPWTSESSKNGFASIRRSPNLPRAKIARSQRNGRGGDMSDSNASLPLKRPLPPPQVNRNPRGTSSYSRSRGGRSYKDQDSDSYSDRSYTTDRNYSEKNFSERNYKPPTYREAMHNESDSSADENSFVQANESRQQTTFVEREITPRAKPKMSPDLKHIPKTPPPPEEDDAYDSIDPKKLKRPTKSKTQEVQKDAESSEAESDTDNQSDEEEESESEEESQTESEDDLQVGAEAETAVYSTPNKNKSKGPDKKQEQVPAQQQGAFRPPPGSHPQHFQQGAPYPGYLPPGVHQPQPRYGYPGQGQPYPQGQTGFPQGQPYPQPQSSAPQGQPKPHPYHQANFTVPLQNASAAAPGPIMHQYPNQANQYPPQVPVQHPTQQHRDRQHSHKPQGHQGQAPVSTGAPPVYSYLVNRGYQPLDGRYSPVSTSTGASNLSGDRNLHTEESDFSPNIDSGVELLKRKT